MEEGYPFYKLFSQDASYYFDNLKAYKPSYGHERYRLNSYFPKYRSFLPPVYQDKPLTIKIGPDNFKKIDLLSNLFIEEVRLKSKRYDQELSPLEFWNDLDSRKIVYQKLEGLEPTLSNLREASFRAVAETGIFRPTWAKSLLQLVTPKPLKWIDISAGWGDRLLTAMSMNMEYLGYDPNTELQAGHSEMIQMFGNGSQQVIYQPFETAVLKQNYYDVCLSSPPYFNLEVYSQDETQSVKSFPTYTGWMVGFLFTSLRKVWDSLKIGGYLILHLGDARTITTCEPTNLFISQYLPGSYWMGIVGVEGTGGKYRPTWIWKKTHQHKGWYGEKSLSQLYPELVFELNKYYAAKYSPNYPEYVKLAGTLEEYCHMRNLDLLKINSLVDSVIGPNVELFDRLAVYSVIESLGQLRAREWVTMLI